MNPFVIIFYSSLVVITALLWNEQRILSKTTPELFKQKDEEKEPWFVLNILKYEQQAGGWYRQKIKPTLVRISLKILKITQSGLQSMRTWVRGQVIRLSVIEDEHKQGRDKHDFFQKLHP